MTPVKAPAIAPPVRVSTPVWQRASRWARVRRFARAKDGRKDGIVSMRKAKTLNRAAADPVAGAAGKAATAFVQPTKP